MCFAMSPCWPSPPFVTRGYIKPSAPTGEDTMGIVQGYIDPSADMVDDTIGNVRGYVEPSADTRQVTIASRVPA